ncbi:VCBS domain-containing protein [Rhizobium miluonense]|uniref:VCBS domain-containing protein n=1 Tax=Rhizobium miluonense TaxID=411945 RepID=UPI001AD7E9F1|nr:VCBS domain-containing protein [Rhizobium miluonense]
MTAQGSITLADPDNPHITGVTNSHGDAATVDAKSGDWQIQGSYGTLSIDADGKYSYTLTTAGVHAGGEQETFTYTVTDAHGNTTTSTLSFTIADDAPVVGDVDLVSISEHALVSANSTTVSGSLGITTFGADGAAASNSVAFSSATPVDAGGNPVTLTSHGQAVQFVTVGATLYGYTGDAPAAGAAPATNQLVFTVGLAAPDGTHTTGSYDFTLYKPLDDGNSANNLSDIKLTFGYTATDGDGSQKAGSFTVDVIDDVPTLVDHASVSATVAETAINAPIVTTASYVIDFNTVTPENAKLTVTEGSVSGNQVGSSAKGGDIVLVSNTGTTFVITQMDIGVFDKKGESSKTVTIIGTDAHGNTYSVTTVGSTFFAADTPLEGKQLTSIRIDPHDNSLTITADNIHVTDTTTTTPTNAPAETTVDLISLVHASADSPLTWSTNAITAGTSSASLTGGTGLTYNGAAITLASADGHTITGSAGGVMVFTLTVDPASGHATFDLYHPIDGGKTLPLDFSKYVTATDFDGDSVTLGSGSVTIVVQSATDNLPAISSTGLVSSVSESGLPGGTGAAGVANVHSGSIAITAGDAPSTVTIDGHTFNVGTAIANGDTNATIQGAYGTLHILSVTATAINYTYTLTGATSGAGNHDAFSVTVSDAPIDGESHTATLTFNITDDKPIASTVSLGSMHENDSSATFTLAPGAIAFGADGAAQSGAIHVDSVSANGDLAGSALSTSIVAIDAGHVTVTPGSALDALALGHSSTLSVGYTVTDGDGSKSSGTFSITVNGVNHAPTAADGSISTGEHTDYYFKPADFAFSDSIDGNALKSVTITSLPTDGMLYLGTTAVTVGQHIAASALTTLHFTPAPEFAGATDTTSFGFTVQDNGGTANGGADTSTAHTMAVNVTAVDDGKAMVSIADQTVHTGKAIVAGDTLNAAITTDDPDHGQSGLTYAWSRADDQSHTVLGTASSYTVTSADVGHSLILTVSYTDGQGFSDVATQTTSAVIAPTVFAPTIDTTPLSEAYLSTGSDPQSSKLTATGSIALGTFDNPHITSVTGADNTAVTVDQAAPGSQTTTIHGSYGDLVIDADGAYTYTLTHAGSNASGDTDQFTYTVTDMNGKTDQATLTFNIADDTPTLTGTGISATLSDDGVVTAADHSAATTAELTSLVNSGADSPLTWSANTVAAGTSSDTLTGGTGLTYNGVAITLASTDGHTITGSAGGDTVFTLTVDGSGHATFVLDKVFDGANDQTLDFSQYVKATDSDGDSVTLGTGAFTIAVDHVNHVAVIAGTDTGAVIEDQNVVGGYLQASGTLTINDADRGESKFQATTINPDSTHLGTLTIGEDGSWSYKVDDSLAAVQSLGVNQSKTDTFTVSSVDGTTHDIIVTINGTNDAPTITIANGDSASGIVTESGIGVANDTAHNTASGHLTGADIDSPSLTWSVVTTGSQTGNPDGSVTGAYGTLSVNTNGTWSYVLDQSKADPLNASDHPQESFTVQLSDGQGGITTQTVVVTVNGTNDAPTISIANGDSVSGIVTEAGIGVANDTAHNTASGHLTGTDIDSPSLTWSVVTTGGQTGNPDGSVTGTYGTLSVSANGTWTYVLDQSKADPLNVSDHPQESFTVQLSDGQGGITTQTVVVTVNGTNDAPTISIANGDSASGIVTEAGIGVANDTAHNTASGHLTGADIDSPSLTWSVIAGLGQTANQNGSVTGAYGTLSVNANGTWSYVLDQSKANPLNVSDHPQESFKVQLSDGQGGITTQTVVVTVNGTNDAPTISIANGDSASGIVTEAGIGVANDTAHNTASGHLSGADVDSSSLTWSVIAGLGQTGNGNGSVTGTYGTLSVSANGTWSYALDQSKADPLNVSDHPQESFTVRLSDGQGGITTQTVVVTVNGTNDAPTITIANGDSAGGTVTEAGIGVANDIAHNTASGHLTGADVDSSSLTWSVVAGGGQTGNGNGSVTGAYGTLSVSANGTWTYALDQSKADPLNVSDHPQESFTVRLSDGQGGITTQTVVVTVNGTNDAASISGTATGSVTEDGQLTANGALTVADVDNGQNHFQAPSSLTGTYGTFTFNATTGAWGYTLNNSASNVQALNSGQTVTDKLTVASADGTASQDIVVTIHGTNEPVSAPSISSVIDHVGSIQGSLANGAVTDDTNLGIRVSLTGTSAVSGDTVQLYNGTTALGTAVTLTSTNISNGYIDITTPTLTNGATYNFRASITDGGVTTPLSPSGAYDIKIDTTAPTVAIAQSSAGGNNLLTFTFSEAVSGFTVSDIVGSGNYTLSNFTHVGLNGFGQDVYTVNYASGNNGWKTASIASGSYTDLAGNSGSASALDFKPAGISGEAINLALAAPTDHVGAVTLSVAGLPAGWVLSEGTHNADGTWSVVTNDPSSLTVTSPDGHTGALVLQVVETWINPDGTTGMATVADNVEAYAKGSPIFAWSGDDTLTASSGNDTLVFANTIGKDVVHNFDTAHDKIDLIGFAGFNSFADVQAHLSADASGSAVITLGDGETITLAGVSVAALTADDFLFNEAVVTHNTGDMVLSDGALMPFSGMLDNTGSIHLASTGSNTAFEIVQHGLTLTGGGTVTLSDNASNVIFGSGDNVTLTNVDNTISGAGQLGEGHLTLVNQGTIIADGSHALVIDTGVNAVRNSGTLEATGTGGLDIHSGVVNDGVLWANGSNVHLEGNVSGSGTVLVSGHAGLEIGGSFSEAISLSKDAQASVTIDHAAAFTGTIAGLDGNDVLRFGDISAATASFAYAENAAKTGGVLTVTDGTHTAAIGLTGDYSAGDFSLGHDGAYAEIDFSGVGHLYGTDGSDTLTSGGGYTMTGGAGADTFVLDAQALHNLNMADVITDFSPKGEGDRLDVSNLLNALVGEHPGMTEASAIASMTAAVDTATNSTKISVNTGPETHVVATLQNYTPTGHDAVHVLFNNHDEQLATHTQTAGA